MPLQNTSDGSSAYKSQIYQTAANAAASLYRLNNSSVTDFHFIQIVKIHFEVSEKTVIQDNICRAFGPCVF